MWKYEQEFRIDKPETVGETDKHFDLDNYKDWLEEQIQALRTPDDSSLICQNCGETDCINIQITTKEATCGNCHNIWQTCS